MNLLGNGFVGLKITLANDLVSVLVPFIWLNLNIIGIGLVTIFITYPVVLLVDRKKQGSLNLLSFLVLHEVVLTHLSSHGLLVFFLPLTLFSVT